MISKAFETVLALFALVFVSFLFLHLLPGGPFDDEVSLNPEVKNSLDALWSLNQPFFVQFWNYLKGLLSGDLGVSMIHAGTPVKEIISQGFLQTVSLNGTAIFLAFGAAFATSVMSTLFPGFCSKSIQGFSIFCIALPSLFLGPVLIYFFGFYFDLLPTAFLTSPSHYILPVITLMLRPWAQLNLLLSNNLQESMGMDFIRTARAKGVPLSQIVTRHALKNSLVPVLALSGPMIAGLISGSFLVEILFSIQGLGQQFAESLNQRDYTVILALILFYGSVLILLTNLFEVIATRIDPRMKASA